MGASVHRAATDARHLFLGVIGEGGLAFDTSGPVARITHLMRGGAVASAEANTAVARRCDREPGPGAPP